MEVDETLAEEEEEGRGGGGVEDEGSRDVDGEEEREDGAENDDDDGVDVASAGAGGGGGGGGGAATTTSGLRTCRPCRLGVVKYWPPAISVGRPGPVLSSGVTCRSQSETVLSHWPPPPPPKQTPAGGTHLVERRIGQNVSNVFGRRLDDGHGGDQWQ